jgi:hypothetical protein
MNAVTHLHLPIGRLPPPSKTRKDLPHYLQPPETLGADTGNPDN